MGDHNEDDEAIDQAMIKQDILDYAAKNFVTDDPKKQAQYNDVCAYLTTRKVFSLHGWNNRHSVETYALFDGAKKAPDVGVYLTKLKRDDAAAAVKSEQAKQGAGTQAGRREAARTVSG